MKDSRANSLSLTPSFTGARAWSVWLLERAIARTAEQGADH